MNYNYEDLLSMLGKDEADRIYNIAWLKPEEEKQKKIKPEKEYTKLTEYEHWKILHKRLSDKWIRHTHIPNESWQAGTKNIVIMMAKKKASWVSKWFPDYIIFLKDKEWNNSPIYIELKKAKWKRWGANWTSVSDEQIEWIEFLNKWASAYVCYWYKEAINIINKHI
jgi:hypothetical protein